MEIRTAETAEDVARMRELMAAYGEEFGFARWSNTFEQEVATLPGRYGPPAGRLLVALREGAAAGCGALCPLEESICEMKRVYVRPAYRRQGLGRAVVERLITEARGMGYAALRLDTWPEAMGIAERLYQNMGFYSIPAWEANRWEKLRFYELKLR